MSAIGTVHPSGDELSRERTSREKESAMPAIRRILVPIDWSEPSKCAFRWAASLAQQHGAELIILYVVPLPTVMYGPAPDNYLKHMREELDRIKPADPTTRIDHLLAEGDPATAIVHAAGENQCDLIVMGTHARTGLNRLLVGSVAEEVARKAPCPVLTVKTEVAADSIGRARTHEEVKEPSN